MGYEPRPLLSLLLCLALLANGIGSAWSATLSAADACLHTTMTVTAGADDLHASHANMEHAAMKHAAIEHAAIEHASKVRGSADQAGPDHHAMHHPQAAISQTSSALPHSPLHDKPVPEAQLDAAQQHCDGCMTPATPASPPNQDCACDGVGCICVVAGFAALADAASSVGLTAHGRDMPARPATRAHAAPRLPYPLRPPIS